MKYLGFLKDKLHKFILLNQNRSIVLLYHRVFNAERDPQLLCVSVDNFTNQIKSIKKNFNVLSLEELAYYIRLRKIPNKSVVLTFDDGYLDNFIYAKPILEYYQVPATIFVTCNYIDKDKEFWWDELESILLYKKNLPNNLELFINGKNYLWNLNEDDEYFWNDIEMWDVTKGDLGSKRLKLYFDLHEILKLLNFNERETILNYLRIWAGINVYECRKFYRCMNLEELIAIKKSCFINVGSHGMTHSLLSNQDLKELEYEIITSKDFMERRLQQNIDQFSYPFGGFNDFNDEALNLVKKAQYESAVANFSGLVTKDTNLFKIPRYLVRNWGEDLFLHNLNKWFYAK